jgi:hypothetical protein
MERPDPFSLKMSLLYILSNEEIENTDKILPVKERNKRNIFDRLMFEIHKHFDIKDKIGRGNIFELFCLEWLKATGDYKNIWHWKNVSDDFKKKMGIKKKKTSESGETKKRDIGIDIIVENKDETYSAIQCKYMNPVKGRPVNYGKLSTFNSLCSRSKIPFKEEILMVNVYQYGGKFDNDIVMKKNQRVINSTLFRRTPRNIWEKMAGHGEGYVLGTASGTLLSGRKNLGSEESLEIKERKEEKDSLFPGTGIKLNSNSSTKLNKVKELKKIKSIKMPGKGEKLSQIKEPTKTSEELREQRLKVFSAMTENPKP